MTCLTCSAYDCQFNDRCVVCSSRLPGLPVIDYNTIGITDQMVGVELDPQELGINEPQKYL